MTTNQQPPTTALNETAAESSGGEQDQTDQTARLDPTVPLDQLDQDQESSSSILMAFSIILRSATLPTWVAHDPNQREAFHQEFCRRLKDALTTSFADWGGTIDCDVTWGGEIDGDVT